MNMILKPEQFAFVVSDINILRSQHLLKLQFGRQIKFPLYLIADSTTSIVIVTE